MHTIDMSKLKLQKTRPIITTEPSIEEVIKIEKAEIEGKEINAVNARDLHKFLEIGKAFRAWISERIKQFDFIVNQDFVIIDNLSRPNSDSPKSRPQIIKDYYISLHMAKELSMIERNRKGKEARVYFIKCEEDLKKVTETKPITNSDDQILMVLDVIKQMRMSQLELEREQFEMKSRLSKVEKQQERKANLLQLLPPVNEMTARNKLNELVRDYVAKNTKITFRDAWDDLYREFYYRNNINLKVRAKNRGISVLEYVDGVGLLEDLFALAIELFS